MEMTDSKTKKPANKLSLCPHCKTSIKNISELKHNCTYICGSCRKEFFHS